MDPGVCLDFFFFLTFCWLTFHLVPGTELWGVGKVLVWLE